MYVCFKIETLKSVVAPIKWNIEKTPLWMPKIEKEELKKLSENHVDLWFHLALSTGIYLFKINNKTERHMSKVNKKGTRSNCETKLLQMCLFSIILTSLHSFNLSFLLLFNVISTVIPKFLPWFQVSPHWFSAFSAFHPRFPTYPCWFLTFPFHSLHSFRSQIPHFGFYR